MLKSILTRWADLRLAKDNARLETVVAELNSRIRLQQLELDELAAIITRNLRRVEAETAIASRRIADAEGQ